MCTYARQVAYSLKREDYALPKERFGRIGILFYAGDHLHLPPVPQKSSMLAPLLGAGQEHRVGAAIFRNCEYVFQLKNMMRFKDDEQLKRILAVMRTPGGSFLAEQDWQALLATEMSSDENPAPEDWFHTSYVWSVVALSTVLEARASARRQQKTLLYVHAVDVVKNHAGRTSAVYTWLFSECRACRERKDYPASVSCMLG
jgi:hypothetical protein